MKEFLIFSTPIWVDSLQFDFKKVSNACLKLKQKNHPNRIISNAGGWQSDDIELEKHKDLKKIKTLLDSKIEQFNSYVSPEFHSRLNNIWININEKGNYNRKHVHPGMNFSGTIYTQVDDDSGNITFFDEFTPIQHYPFKYVNNARVFNKNFSIIPKTGMIIIFPSWLPHQVEVCNSEIPRISLSFNIEQI